jgi:hypothetical protein
MKRTLLSLLIIIGICALSLGAAEAAEDLVVAVDRATLIKLIGGGILAFQVEIWRNQRVLFRSNEKLGKELKALQGYCKGKSGDCAEDDRED